MTEQIPAPLPVAGIRLGCVAAGIRYQNRKDLVLVELAEGATCAALFTRNQFCAAPVKIAREHLSATRPRYLLINSGNANAGTGDAGLRDAVACCRTLAVLVGSTVEQVLPFSTGVIGEPLPVDRFTRALPEVLEALSGDGWLDAARAIMTTDTIAKFCSRQVVYEGRTFTVTGMAKGSGMIRPDMATMLAYIATDLAVETPLLQRALQCAVAPSFNSITVDGDTSTNDACVLMATGLSLCTPLTDLESELYPLFSTALNEVCMELALAIVRDGEGATKLVNILVEQALTAAEARDVAYTIAHSPLVKTALFASDPNWGRILAAVGRANVPALVIEQVEIWLGDLCIVSGGGRAAGYNEAAGQAAMQHKELTIRVVLGRGQASARVFTCDLSHEYVRINAEYRS
ncbi:MAG: bifunctional glutamate N-acetyltransferase/amino-acid acetyltransferase ArgJ [Gammaproteobacteria bacterium]|nr:bifunctional glutamate N-acetyltransferase/amino-acid acetyltransferase ArgJ [Gammaproteobacteria bacterium]MCP5415763.1 bifunctional glutamate N-acetyltransferase/amino-acid acetyltransferase ArgJ [Chromatiaceae bacterium]